MQASDYWTVNTEVRIPDPGLLDLLLPDKQSADDFKFINQNYN